jgi:molybdopterin/thiamine biosynthesis adenylyltransferase
MSWNERLRHERAYRGDPLLEKLAGVAVTVCGAGALGSWMVENLARQGFQRIRVIDHDRVEAHNLGNQLYAQADVGAFKVQALQNLVFQAAGVEIEAVDKRLEEGSCVSLLKGSDLVVDALDNSQGRRLVTRFCGEHSVPCLHLGMNGGYGEVHWNEGYRVPGDPEEGDVCDAPLARNLVLLLTAVGGEAIIRFLSEGTRRNYAITLEDLQIHPGD